VRAARESGADPYEAQVTRLIVDRAPWGFLFFLGCVGLSTVFEVVRFPGRRPWMLSFAAAFTLLAAAAHALIRARPAWSVPVLVGFVNVVGVALNVYHALVGAPVAMCLWTLTALLASSAVIIPWRGRTQAVASLGATLAYPLHLEVGATDLLTWAAGASYLAVVVAMSVFGAALYERHVRAGFRLTSALSEREARLQSYFDFALVGTAVFAPDGACREVNDELCRILGYEREELLARRWDDLTAPAERAAGAALLRRALADPGAPPVELRLVRREGVTIHASVGMRGLPGPGGIDHVIAVVQDVSDRKRIEAEREAVLARELAARREAEAASHAKDTFLATVSHELRTPLSPILAWSDLLRRGQLDREQVQRAIAAIERNAGVQAQLIEDLLDVSRIVAGKLRLDRQPVELEPVVREAVEIVRPAALAKGVELELALDGGGCQVSGDADRLRQVCWNLLSNAVKFTPAGGQVRIALAQDRGAARISVSDTGQGIDPEFLPHIFERFRQADPGSTREHGGLGIGLAIVRELVELHGGRVWAESRGEGRGALFTVELPLLEGVERTTPAPVGARDYAPLDGLRILVVDDDPDSNDVVETLLSSCGAEVRTAGSVPAALALLASWRPDVLVSDLSMPGEDGYSLIARLRTRDPHSPRVPAIALTAYAGPADRDHVLAAGFEAHVRKPFRSAELVTAIETAARRRA
jgi:PAS domain S-box-containing protein